MKLTTLCYLEHAGSYLMLHRVSKKNDVNANKWIGVGGKFEAGEAPEDCLVREVLEETGYRLNSWRYRGCITFIYDNKEAEIIFTYTSDDFERAGTGTEADPLPEGTPVCPEGVLKWVPFEELMELEVWEGDRYLLEYLLKDRQEPFSLKLIYDAQDQLLRAEELGERRIVLKG